MTQELPGGRITAVQQRGDTVVRRLSANSDFVHRLLRQLAEQGWNGAPRVLGVDGKYEVLSFIDGEVPWQEPTPSWAVTENALRALAALLRQLHDLTAGTPLAGTAEVVCHHDLSPSNTVYRRTDGVPLPVAFLDWDIAGPGRRIEDVAHVCWQWLDLGPRVTDIAQARRGVTLLADAYGLHDRAELVPTIVWWQNRCWRGIEAAARAGDPAMRRLVDDGTSAGVRAAEQWTIAHGDDLLPAPA